MHIICDDCFKKVGPIEELTIGIIKGSGVCAYCNKKLEGEDFRESHRLTGDTPRFDLCHKLGVSTSHCSYFERDVEVEFEQELQRDPQAMAQQAIEWLNSRDEYGEARVARIIEVLRGPVVGEMVWCSDEDGRYTRLRGHYGKLIAYNNGMAAVRYDSGDVQMPRSFVRGMKEPRNEDWG